MGPAGLFNSTPKRVSSDLSVAGMSLIAILQLSFGLERCAPVLAFRIASEAKMPENKTKATNVSVSAYIDGLTDPERRSDAKELVEVMQRVSGEKPRLWGPSIVGFGSYHYKYESGREGDMPLISFSPRKSAMVLYSMLAHADAKAVLAKLGRHTTGKGCLYIKKLADVDQTVLETLIENAVAHYRARTKKAS
jgi:hypothetical protein